MRIGSTRSPAARDDARERGPARLPAAAVGAGLGVAVAVDGVVAGVGEAVERARVDAGVEHGDRRLGVQPGLLDRRVAGHRHGLAARRIGAPHGPHLRAGVGQPRDVARSDRGREAVPDAVEGDDVAQDDAARLQPRAQRDLLALERGDVDALLLGAHRARVGQLAQRGPQELDEHALLGLGTCTGERPS